MLLRLAERSQEASKAAVGPRRLPPLPEPMVDRNRLSYDKAAESLLGSYAVDSRRARLIGRITAAASAAFGVFAVAVLPSSGTTTADQAESTPTPTTASATPAVMGPSLPPTYGPTMASASPTTAQVIVDQTPPVMAPTPAADDDKSGSALLGVAAALFAAGSAAAFVTARRRITEGINVAFADINGLMDDAMAADFAERQGRKASDAAKSLRELRVWLFDEWAALTPRAGRAPMRQGNDGVQPPELGLPGQ